MKPVEAFTLLFLLTAVAAAFGATLYALASRWWIQHGWDRELPPKPWYVRLTESRGWL